MSATIQDIRVEARSRFRRSFNDDGHDIYMFLFVALAVIPGACFSGILGTPLSPQYLRTAYSLATIAALLGLCLFYPDRRYWHLGVIPGLITGPALIFLPRFYILTVVLPYRDWVWNVELALPILCALMPTWLLWYVPLKYRVIRDIEYELSRSRTHVQTC